MGKKKPLAYRNLRKILKRYGIHEEKGRRGKGSERMFVGIVEALAHAAPIDDNQRNDARLAVLLPLLTADEAERLWAALTAIQPTGARLAA